MIKRYINTYINTCINRWMVDIYGIDHKKKMKYIHEQFPVELQYVIDEVEKQKEFCGSVLSNHDERLNTIENIVKNDFKRSPKLEKKLETKKSWTEIKNIEDLLKAAGLGSVHGNAPDTERTKRKYTKRKK